MTYDVRTLAPLKINSTTIPVEDLQVPPEVASEAFRHSGNEFASAFVVPGAAPRARWRMPAKTAYDLIGLKTLKATVFDIHLAKFVDSIKSASSVHTKYPLATSALATVFIRSITFGERKLAMADCEAIFTSSDGMIHPIGSPSLVALPTLAAQPELHIGGPCEINTSGAIAGVLETTIDLAPEIEIGLGGNPGDGLLYPTVATYVGGTPSIEVGHGDPVALLALLGFVGLPVTTSFKAWMRDIDATSKLALATGVSFTIGVGRAVPVDFGAGSGRHARGGLRIQGMSVSTTHPIVVATGTVPVV